MKNSKATSRKERSILSHKKLYLNLFLWFALLIHSSCKTKLDQSRAQQSPLSQRSISLQEINSISELHLAAEQGDIKAVRRSLDAGTDVDSVLGKASYRVLHKAAREGSLRMVEFLLERGADINARAEYGWTPLDLAIKRNQKEMIQILRANGGKTDRELIDKTSVTWLKVCLNTYKLDMGHYPTKEEGGLDALSKQPTPKDPALRERWKGPYLKSKEPMFDEWGRQLNYESKQSDYNLYSSGPDGKPKTKDDVIFARSFDWLNDTTTNKKSGHK